MTGVQTCALPILSLDDVQEIGREIVHLRGEDPDPVDEVVVRDDGWDRREQPDSSGDEGLRDGPSHNGQAHLDRKSVV